jgi:hypothetical protein
VISVQRGAPVVGAVDAAVVLLVEPVGAGRVEAELVDALAGVRILAGEEVGADARRWRGSRCRRRRRSGRRRRRTGSSRAGAGLRGRAGSRPARGRRRRAARCCWWVVVEGGTLSQLSPASRVTKRPAGSMPAQRVSGSSGGPGARNQMALRARSSGSGARRPGRSRSGRRRRCGGRGPPRPCGRWRPRGCRCAGRGWRGRPRGPPAAGPRSASRRGLRTGR